MLLFLTKHQKVNGLLTPGRRASRTSLPLTTEAFYHLPAPQEGG